METVSINNYNRKFVSKQLIFDVVNTLYKTP